MKKILKLFIGVIIFISFGNVYALELSSEPIEPIEPIDSVTMSSFIKKDEKGNLIDSAIFKQTSISGYEMDASINSFLKQKSSQQSQQFIPVTGGNESGNDDHVVYRFINGYNDKEDAYKLLTPDQKAIFDNMQTLNDYNRIKNSVSNSSEDIAYCSGKDAYVTYLKESKGIVASEFHDFNGTPDNPSTDPSVLRKPHYLDYYV